MIRSFCLFCILIILSSCVTSKKNIQKADYHHKIAIGLLSKCDKPRALSHLLEAIKLNPRDFIVRNTLAAVYYSMGQYHKALTEYKNILKRKSDFTEARVNLARIYMDIGHTNQSLKEIKKAEKDITYTNYLKLVSQKALTYYKQEKYELAKKWLEEAHSLPKGKVCFIYLNLGKTELALGNFKESEQFLKKALFSCRKEKKPLCQEPSYEEHLVLAQLYIKKRNKKRAKYHLNLFLQKTKTGSKIKTAKKLLEQIS